MTKELAIKHAAGVQQTAHSLRDELNRDTVNMQEVRTWLEWIEDELAKLKKALGEIGIGT
jgi:hypothetical protein